MEYEETLGPDTVGDVLAHESSAVLGRGVEREQMLASLQSRLFGAGAPVQLGRFELGARLGAGAMGVVYEARDPQLDRKVALKVLRSENLDGSRVERLMLEARALAKLRHPNVVTVYEVGRDDEDRFIVMDLVQGQTLRAWLDTQRPWREIVRMFVRAGQGLQAAHEAGLVHRDFKPDNVLVEDGQPKVVDFGLAAATDDPVETTARDLEEVALPLDRCTQTGGFVGTPAYMAPEQYGGQATPAADQYAFCVALFEALEGERPYASAEGSGIGALLLAQQDALPTTVPSRAPRWLRRVLARGLSHDASKRWPSMTALLAALRRVDGAGRRRWAAAVGVTGVAGIAAGLGSQWGDDPPAPGPCADASAAVEASWSKARRKELERAFEQTGLAYAPQTWERVSPVLDAYAAAWRNAAQRACAADLAADDPLPPLNVARGVCLDRRRSDFESLLETFAAPDADTVDRAVDAAATIPSLQQCDEAVLLREQLERGQDRNVAPAQLYESLAAADAANRTGGDVVARARDVLAKAREVGDQELEALAARLLAQALARSGDLEGALAAASEGVEAAELLGDSRLRARVQLELLSVLTEQRAFDDATRQSRFVDAALRRLGDPPAQRISLSVLQGWLLLHRGELEAALEQFERTEALIIETRPVAPAVQGRVLAGKGSALEQLGRHPEAADTFERSVELLAERLGPSTPRVVSARMKLATSLANLGRAEEGIAQAQQAVRDADAVLGDGDLMGARARATLAIAYASSGELVQAETLLRDAAVVIEKHLGPENPDSAACWMNLARILPHLDKSAEAVEVLEHSAEILRHTLPADHPDFVFIKTNLADAHIELEAWDEALRVAREAEAIGRAHFSDDNARMAPIRIQVGTALRGLGDLAQARRTLEAVVEDLQHAGARSALIAVAQFELALVETDAGAIPTATALMNSARAAFEADGTHDRRVRAIDAWLEENR